VLSFLLLTVSFILSDNRSLEQLHNAANDHTIPCLDDPR
jgi:hypothetical protein